MKSLKNSDNKGTQNLSLCRTVMDINSCGSKKCGQLFIKKPKAARHSEMGRASSHSSFLTTNLGHCHNHLKFTFIHRNNASIHTFQASCPTWTQATLIHNREHNATFTDNANKLCRVPSTCKTEKKCLGYTNARFLA